MEEKDIVTTETVKQDVVQGNPGTIPILPIRGRAASKHTVKERTVGSRASAGGSVAAADGASAARREQGRSEATCRSHERSE